MDDQAAREAQAELLAEAKALHKPMKLWYNENETLKAQHGDFPMFSRELPKWSSYREVLKAYKAREEAKEKETAKKKRRSRWGNAEESAAPSTGAATTKKKSRWGNKDSTAITKTAGGLQSLHQQKTFLLRLQIDEINRKLLTVVYDAKIAENNPDRSPSPEPIYDNKGKRTNTREVRMRQNLETKKQNLLEELVKLNPSLKPANMKMSSLTRKIPIPAKDYPGYNFIGLIIGPRGNTQKQMEGETNTKISIRGKGSVKPGRRARDGRPQEDSNEELHVLIQGQDEDGLERACEMVKQLLKPVDDQNNDHKQKQLRELAMINGTLREDHYCTNCGQPGHRQWECPNQAPISFKMADVTCAICGDKSHPTADCPKKNQGEEANQSNAIDADYYEFMEMVGGEAAPKPKPPVPAAAPAMKPPTVTTAAPPAPQVATHSVPNQAGQLGNRNLTPPPGLPNQPPRPPVPAQSHPQQQYYQQRQQYPAQTQQYPPAQTQQYPAQTQQYPPRQPYYPPQQQHGYYQQPPMGYQQHNYYQQQPMAHQYPHMQQQYPPQPPMTWAPQPPQPPQPPQAPEPPKMPEPPK